jgi:hypothetical protein
LQSKGLTNQAEKDPFDSITDKIPERPVSVAEGASYSLVILAGLAVAGFAAYAVLKELIFEPKEYVKLYSVCTLVYAGRIIVFIPLWQNYATSQLHQG